MQNEEVSKKRYIYLEKIKDFIGSGGLHMLYKPINTSSNTYFSLLAIVREQIENISFNVFRIF